MRFPTSNFPDIGQFITSRTAMRDKRSTLPTRTRVWLDGMPLPEPVATDQIHVINARAIEVL